LDATWNELFTLSNIPKAISSGNELKFEALDKDTFSEDWIGSTTPI
jgi:hypothetical protein